MELKKKNILIAGVTRAGKTTTCLKLNESPFYHHYETDGIVTAFEEKFPEHGIQHDEEDLCKVSHQFAPFINTLLWQHEEDGLPYALVVDTYYITPEDYIKYMDKNYCDAYFFAYPNINIEEKFKEIRKFDTSYDYTGKHDDAWLHDWLVMCQKHCNLIQEQCKEYNLPLIDTSFHREETIAKFVKEILQA